MGFLINLLLKYTSRGTSILATGFKFLKVYWKSSNSWFHGVGIVGLITSFIWPFIQDLFDRFTSYVLNVPFLAVEEIIGVDATQWVKYLLWQFQIPLLFSIGIALIAQWLMLHSLYFYALCVKIVRSLIP